LELIDQKVDAEIERLKILQDEQTTSKTKNPTSKHLDKLNVLIIEQTEKIKEAEERLRVSKGPLDQLNDATKELSTLKVVLQELNEDMAKQESKKKKVNKKEQETLEELFNKQSDILTQIQTYDNKIHQSKSSKRQKESEEISKLRIDLKYIEKKIQYYQDPIGYYKEEKRKIEEQIEQIESTIDILSKSFNSLIEYENAAKKLTKRKKKS